ncbi:hypothetical protein EON62_04315 [archaeon]|nr:MAG: hypothetical protein EON62_04315 [archaeon]
MFELHIFSSHPQLPDGASLPSPSPPANWHVALWLLSCTDVDARFAFERFADRLQADVQRTSRVWRRAAASAAAATGAVDATAPTTEVTRGVPAHAAE